MPTAEQASPSQPDLTAKVGAIEGQMEALRSHGRRSGQRVSRLRRAVAENFCEPPKDGGTLDAVQKLLETVNAQLGRSEWSDRARSHVIFHLAERLADAPETLRYIQRNIGVWLEHHRNEWLKVALCLSTVPPDGIAVERVLDAGAQKQVFVARWPEVTSRPVALKHFRGGLLDRGPGDAFPHPLRGHHPNIIETFVLSEDKDSGEVFLVERLLGQTLKDDWDFCGIAEIVNLVRDIANALSFVHGHKHMHGDIKLDNMGIEHGRYILLDFGLCRPEAQPDHAWTPTGNLRTRAPELLRDKRPNSASSDVWALGAVAFHALIGHPPFFEKGEKQAGFAGEDRDEIIETLAKRADPAQWDEQIGVPLKQEVTEYGLQQLLEQMLSHDAEDRMRAAEVVQRCDDVLGWMVRPEEVTIELSPAAQLDQLEYLQSRGDLARASYSRRLDLREAAKRLGEAKLSAGELDRLAVIEGAL